MTFKSTLKAHFDLFRASLGVLSCLAVVGAGYIIFVLKTGQKDIITFVFHNGVLAWHGIILGLIATMLILFATHSLNDYHDVETDKANKRFDRPIARGDLTREYVLKTVKFNYSLAILIIAFLVLFYRVTPILLLFTFFCVGLGIIYNYIKRTGFLGNLWVALGYVAPLFIGIFLLRPDDTLTIQASYLILLTTFFLATGREIVKDIQDYEGDLQSNLNTLAIKIGPKKAGVISAIFFFLVLLTSTMVGLFIYKNVVYWFSILVLFLILAWTIYTIMTEEPSTGGKKARKYTRWSLWWALLSFLFGVVFRV